MVNVFGTIMEEIAQLAYFEGDAYGGSVLGGLRGATG